MPPWAVSVAGPGLAATLWITLPASPRLALAAFLSALLCDALDGALARRLGVGSSRGKLVDQVCDTATLAAVLAAASNAGWVSPPLAVIAAVAVALTLYLALARRAAETGSWLADPRGGMLAHLPKLPVYGAVTVQLLGGPALVPPAVVLALALAGLACAGLVVGRRPLRRSPRRSAAF